MQLNRVMAQLNLSRLKRQRELEERKAYVYTQLPALALVTKKIKETGLLHLKSSLTAARDSEQLVLLTKQLCALKEEERAILSQHPHYAAMLEPRFDCALCKDTGYDDKKQLCACVKNMLYQADIDQTATFENFNVNIFPCSEIPDKKMTMRDLMKNHLQTAENYCNAFPNNPKPNLFLNGKTGLGKTYLLHCIANRIKQRGYGVCCFTAYSLFDRLRRHALEDEPIDDILTCDLLVIDDLGTEPMYQKVTMELLYMVINHRTNKHLPLCTATNLSVGDLISVYSDRIVSRLLFKPNTEFLGFRGTDIRVL